MIQSYKEKYEIMAKTTSISVEKFIDYLSPILYELGTEVIQMESPACYDTDGYGYLAKSRFLHYGHCTEFDDQEAIEKMADSMKREVEVRIMTEEHEKCDMHTERLGIYTIHIQHEKEDLLLWVRYCFGDKKRKLQGIKKVGNGKN